MFSLPFEYDCFDRLRVVDDDWFRIRAESKEEAYFRFPLQTLQAVTYSADLGSHYIAYRCRRLGCLSDLLGPPGNLPLSDEVVETDCFVHFTSSTTIPALSILLSPLPQIPLSSDYLYHSPPPFNHTYVEGILGFRVFCWIRSERCTTFSYSWMTEMSPEICLDCHNWAALYRFADIVCTAPGIASTTREFRLWDHIFSAGGDGMRCTIMTELYLEPRVNRYLDADSMDVANQLHSEAYHFGLPRRVGSQQYEIIELQLAAAVGGVDKSVIFRSAKSRLYEDETCQSYHEDAYSSSS
ncbi:hypothetical protein Tco_1069344 [Tanacetum coccineum]|uniref:Uncharacterized protein n=1 Tax=Tanacetum coccineum TaxID=301880 RepID=A0ABQ5HK45_9ASTR